MIRATGRRGVLHGAREEMGRGARAAATHRRTLFCDSSPASYHVAVARWRGETSAERAGEGVTRARAKVRQLRVLLRCGVACLYCLCASRLGHLFLRMANRPSRQRVRQYYVRSGPPLHFALCVGSAIPPLVMNAGLIMVVSIRPR